MHTTRKIIRAFLASPGDLKEEREAIRDVVNEFNEMWANELGYQVELIGWEETVARFGRPQHLINQDLDRCDLFLGMMWKRWGTPPDEDGRYSSGFQEEFERSMARCNKNGSPEISLFFKRIPDEFMVDPGADLKKVLDFQNEIISGKKILFQNFTTVRDMETLARKCITAYVNSIKAKDDLSDPSELQTKRARTDSEEAINKSRTEESSSKYDASIDFLENIINQFKDPDSLDLLNASDVARFRLLANLTSKPGNDEMNLGVHDNNILYTSCIKGLKLGQRENRYLARLGFKHFNNENVPLWLWYSASAYSKSNPAIVSSLFPEVNEEETAGAISVLTLLGIELPIQDESINRDMILSIWFSDESSSKVKTAALEYLARFGNKADIEIARKEYTQNNYETSRTALECMAEILLRTGQIEAAQKLIIDSQFESFKSYLLKPLLSEFERLETSFLLLGLEHRNSQVRLYSLKALHSRDALDMDTAERLSCDSNAFVRNEAVKVLSKKGKIFTEEDIKKILTQSRNKNALNLLSGNSLNVDQEGEELFRQYKYSLLKNFSESELKKKISASLMYDSDEYFVLMEKYFSKNADELRRDVDDRFSTYFEHRIKKAEAAFSNATDIHDLIKKYRDLEEYRRKKLTRQGLNILCAAQKSEDLLRIRANLRDGYAGASKLDAEYLGKYGEWIDITVLINAEGPKIGSTLLIIPNDKEYQEEVAKSILSISKHHSISDLLSLEMPATILKKTIDICSELRFTKISNDALFHLFNHKSDAVRKAAAIMAVRSFSAKRIKAILSEYIGSDKYRYYNVIHWLDLGVSLRRADAIKVARAASN
ncbi:MAG: DUF4062 domain-containing protein [Chlorobaculum sp.]|nr:DUF4062 domain-containing protein [Chlorobaculum sp.]